MTKFTCIYGNIVYANVKREKKKLEKTIGFA